VVRPGGLCGKASGVYVVTSVVTPYTYNHRRAVLFEETAEIFTRCIPELQLTFQALLLHKNRRK